MKWQKTDKTGTPVEDEDNATLDPDDQPTGGGNGGGNTDTGDDIEG